MTMQDVDARGGYAAGGREKSPFWARTASAWCQTNAPGEASFVRPGRPSAWRRVDPDFAAECDEIDLDADRRVVETVRQRALQGDRHAQTLSFRASRGMARPVDVTSRPRDTDNLPPEVAAAMIEAGLAAIAASSAGRPFPHAD